MRSVPDLKKLIRGAGELLVGL